MTSASTSATPTRAKPRRSLLSDLFQEINAHLEPYVRAGLGSPGLLPAGLIVLETKGRRSGQTHRTPLVATLGPGGYLWVSTVLGARSDWLSNAHANPDISYWLGGEPHQGRAIVSAPGYARPDLSGLPPLTRWAAFKAVVFATALRFGLLIIVPQPEADTTG